MNGGQGDTLLYIQSPLGVKVKLDMSFLDSMVNKDKNANIDVAKAELIIPSDTTLFDNSIASSSLLDNPARLSLQVSATFGNNDLLEPYSYFFRPYNEIFINGFWNKKAYIFNISEYVQEYLNGRTNIKELFIGTPLSDYAVEGVNLRRGNKIKLNLKYSKFKNK